MAASHAELLEGLTEGVTEEVADEGNGNIFQLNSHKATAHSSKSTFRNLALLKRWRVKGQNFSGLQKMLQGQVRPSFYTFSPAYTGRRPRLLYDVPRRNPARNTRRQATDWWNICL